MKSLIKSGQSGRGVRAAVELGAPGSTAKRLSKEDSGLKAGTPAHKLGFDSQGPFLIDSRKLVTECPYCSSERIGRVPELPETDHNPATAAQVICLDCASELSDPIPYPGADGAPPNENVTRNVIRNVTNYETPEPPGRTVGRPLPAGGAPAPLDLEGDRVFFNEWRPDQPLLDFEQEVSELEKQWRR